MAINLNGTTGITTTGLTSNGIDDNSTSTAMTLDSSGRVGIGTSSPDNSLHVSYADSTAYSDATGDFGIQIENTDTTTNAFSQLHFRTGNSDSYIRSIREGNNLASLAFLTDDGGTTGDVGEAMRISSSGLIYINGDGTGGRISGDGTGGLVLQDGNGRQSFKILSPASGSSDAMTLDASGILLVGTTSSDDSTDGFKVKSNGQKLTVTRDGAEPLVLNRRTSDGDIVKFRKDNTTVGSIGNASTNLIVEATSSNRSGLSFGGSITPRRGGASSDSAVDLGTGSYRFKDLYLSGGVYLGGTGSANKLDDYEEGTWTASLHLPPTGVSNNDATSSLNRYIKIGNFVTVHGKVTLNTNSSNASAFRLSGLPFTTGSNVAGTGSCIVRNGASFDFVPYTFSNTTEIHFYQSGTTGNWNQVYYTDITNLEMHFEISYFAS